MYSILVVWIPTEYMYDMSIYSARSIPLHLLEVFVAWYIHTVHTPIIV